jgi:hypothetical protein
MRGVSRMDTVIFFFDWPYELPEEGLIKNTRLSPHTRLDFFTQLSPHGVC